MAIRDNAIANGDHCAILYTLLMFYVWGGGVLYLDLRLNLILFYQAHK